MSEPTDSRMQLPAFRSLSGMSKARLLGYAWDRHQELKAAQARIRLLEQRERDLVSGLMRYADHPRDCRTWKVGLWNATRDDCSCGLWRLIGLPEGWRPMTSDPAPAPKEEGEG